jgi:hypothetical protein
MHENSAFYGIFQIGFMLVGAVLVSSLCRDRRAFYSGLYGYILGCIILTVIVVLTTYGKISSATVTGNFSSASGLRFNAFSDNPLQDNIGGMAFFASQGALLTLILVLNSTKCLQRFVLLGISVLCMVGLFITMSRSGLTDFVLASAAVFYTYGIMRPRVIIIATVIILAVIVLVPPAVFSRLSITTEAEGDSRTPIYLEVIERIPEYILTGVGMGNFYSEWGKQTKFGGKTVGGVHNCVAQVTINWGLIGLIVFLRLIWQAYQCFPRRGGTDSLRLSLLAISVATLAATMFSHNLEDKIFSVALGFLAAADLWIWPQSIARLASWIAVRRISEQH